MCCALLRLKHKLYHITYHLSHNHACLLQGDRGLRGPPGDKPQIQAKMIADMKGAKGEYGPQGNNGFPGPRGVQPLSDISHFPSYLLCPLTLHFLTSCSFPQVLRVCLVCQATRDLMVFLENPAMTKVTEEVRGHRGCQG